MGIFSGSFFDNEDPDKARRDRMNGTTPDYKTLLPPEEERSALRNLGANTLSSLAFVGSVLDKYSGARAIRGVLGDKPEEALSIIPFSDMLGITKPEDSVSGEELNKKFGLFNKDDEGIMPTALGIGTEILLDPATYLTLGGSALTKTGAALAKHGYSPAKNVIQATKGFQNLDELKWLDNGKVYQNLKSTGLKDQDIINEFVGNSLGGPVGLKVPFTKYQTALTGDSGEYLARKAESIGNAIGGAYNYAKGLPIVGDLVGAAGSGANKIGRIFGGAFNSSYNNAYTPEGQRIFREATADEITNTFRGRENANLLRNLLGEDVKYPELLRWSVESGPQVKDFAANPQKLSLNTSLSASMNDALRDIKSSHQDLAKLTDIEILNKAEKIYDKASPFVEMGGQIKRPSSLNLTYNDMSIADTQRLLAGGMEPHRLNDIVRLGDGSEISKTYFPRYANPVVDGRLSGPYRAIDSSAATDAALSTERSLKGLPQGAIDIERMAKDPEITALFSTSSPRHLAQNLDNSAQKIAVDYLKFPDAQAFQESKRQAQELKALFGRDGTDVIEGLRNNGYSWLTDDFYNIVKDANAIVREIANQDSVKLGVTAAEYLKTHTPTDASIITALFDTTKFNIPRNFAGYINPNINAQAKIIGDVKNALAARRQYKLYDSSDQLLSSLPRITPESRAKILASENASNIAETMAKQSPAHLIKDPVMPSNTSLANVSEAPYAAPFYGHILDSLESRIVSSYTGASKAKAVFNEVLNSGIRHGTDQYGTVTLGKALQESGINAQRAINNFADNYRNTNRFADKSTNPLPLGMVDTIERRADELVSHNVPYVVQDLEKMGNMNPSRADIVEHANRMAFAESFKDLRVPQTVVDNIKAEVLNFKPQKALNPVLDMFDKYTNFTKGGLTVIAPGFHGRNLVSGMTTNLASGSGGNQNPLSVLTNAYQADKAASGQVIKGLANDIPLFRQMNEVRAKKGLPLLDDAAATKRFNELLYEYGVISPSSTGELIKEPANLAEKVARQIPGEVPTRSAASLLNPYDLVKKDPVTGSVSLDFKNMVPIKKEGNQLRFSDQDFAPFKWGRDVNQKVEGANRGGAFLGFLKQGFHPEEAARRVAESHVDYSALTSFEKNVMKRAFPFYTFTKKMAPFVIKDIVEHPGGLSAQYAKTAGRMRSQDENTAMLPVHLGSSMLYDVTNASEMLGGVKPEGTRTFFTGLDLPVDVVAQYISNPFSNQAFRGFESLLGATNPLIKAPLELGTNRQFFSHRNLDDLYSPTGNRIIDQIVMNSPFSRVTSMGKTLIDERKDPLIKALNLTLGGRFTDVDTQKWMNLRAKELIKENLTGTPGIGTFEKIYARPDSVQNLSREQIELLRLQRNMENNALLYKKRHPELYPQR